MWSECPHKHKLVYIEEVPYFSENEYTAFGTAMHSACERMIPNHLEDPQAAFQEEFLSEVKSLKESPIDLNNDLLRDMFEQGRKISPQIIPAVREYFNEYEVISIEEELMEDIDDFDSYGRKFKGFIDLVLKTSDGKYHIIDWKTCSWGWSSRKKTDKIINYQLTMYKHFFSKKHSIDPSLIETHFALLKRTAKNNNVEIFNVPTGKQKTINCLKLLERSVINMERHISPKNRLSCKYCKFYKTENCK